MYDYNSKTSYGDLFKGSKYVTWGSNWQAQRAIGSVTLDSSFSFVPTLGVDSSLKNTNWITTVTNLINTGGVTKLFASNEPDNAGQANLKAADAATVYKAYMQPFAGKAKLATPAITNGGGSAGLNYMSDFLNACNGCTFDFINVHHYLQRTDVNVDQAVSALKSYLLNDVPKFQAAHPQLKNAKIIVGEVCPPPPLPKTPNPPPLKTFILTPPSQFWLWGASASESSTYLEAMMPWLDANPAIDSYQAFGGLWTNNFITADGTGLTPAGTAYKDFEAAVTSLT